MSKPLVNLPDAVEYLTRDGRPVAETDLHYLRPVGAAYGLRQFLAGRDDVGAKLETVSEANHLEVRNLALLALRVDSPVPAGLALAAASGGMLTARQEATLVREFAATDPVGALRAGRATDRDDKLELMRELLPVAQVVDDTAYAADLARRIELAETAYRRLGCPRIAGDVTAFK